MNVYFALASGLGLILGLSHSVLGELLLISRLTNAGLPAVGGSTDFARRTLRFSWHLPTVLGLGLTAILLWLSLQPSPGTELAFVERALALSFAACWLVVLLISRGKHPGWVAFLALAVLTWLGGM
jgi:hypothetical protein